MFEAGVKRPVSTIGARSANFPETVFLAADDAAHLARTIASLRIAGGSVHDALVGAAAKRAGLQLATRDHRALDTYRVLDVEIRLIEA